MASMATEWTLIGTGRLNDTGGSGTLTLPKVAKEALMSEYGRDYAIFQAGGRVMFVPRDEVDIDD